MKKLFLLLITGASTLPLLAQNINLVFNAGNANRNFQVVIDGTGYNSARNLKSNGTPVGMTIMLTNFDPGSHSLSIYRLVENNGTVTTSGNALYYNNFTVRNGYDMTINVAGNGQVTFTEKANGGTVQETAKLPMTNTDFQQLLTEIRSNRYQSARISVMKEAFASTTDYFTVSQVKQMLTLITTESSRLELAKLSYDKITDPANFTDVYTLFTVQANRTDLAEFVRVKSSSDPVVVSNGSRDPLTVAVFDQLFQSINYTDQPLAILSLKEAFTHQGYYFTTAQTKKLLMMIGTEADRLELAKSAYLRITDAAAFTIAMYPLFYTPASRQELSTYIRRNGGTAGNPNITFLSPMADAQFNELVAKARKHFFPWDAIKDIKDAFADNNNHFTTYQVRQLLNLVGGKSILTSETDKLDLAKQSYRTLTDPANFMQLLDVFTASANKEALVTYVGTQLL